MNNNRYLSNKKVIYQGLDKVVTYLTDTSEYSKLYFNINYIPEYFAAGKNLIIISGNSNFLKVDSEVKMELLDSNNTPIYLEYHKYTDIYGRRYITAHIQNNVAQGTGLLTIIGVATKVIDENGISRDINANYRNSFNLKWSKRVRISPFERNISQIAFMTPPTIEFVEDYRNDFYVTYPYGNPRTSIFQAPGGYKIQYSKKSNQTGINASNYNSMYLPSTDENLNIDEISRGNITVTADNINENRRISTDSNRKTTYRLKSRGNTTFSSEILQEDNSGVYPNGISIISTEYDTPDETFSGYDDIAGGTFEISASAIVDYSNTIVPPAGYKFSDKSNAIDYSGKIVRFINKKTIEVSPPYIREIVPINDDNAKPIEYIIPFISASEIVLKWSGQPIYTSVPAYSNIAKIKISGLNTVGGEIDKVRIYSKFKNSVGDFKLLSEEKLQSYNLLISSESIEYRKSIGKFVDRDIIDNYWVSDLIDARVIDSMSFSNSVMVNAMRVGTKNYESGHIVIEPIIDITYDEDSDYEITANIIFNNSGSNNSISDSTLTFLMSGSAFDNTDKFYNLEGDIAEQGRIIGRITPSGNDEQKDFKKLIFKFTPDSGGIGKFKIIVTGGYWYLSDINIKSCHDVGYNPSSTEFLVNLEPKWDNTTYDFKFEYVDYLGNVADQYTILKNVLFEHGKSTLIQGSYNLLYGTLFVTGTINMTGSMSIDGLQNIDGDLQVSNYIYHSPESFEYDIIGDVRTNASSSHLITEHCISGSAKGGGVWQIISTEPFISAGVYSQPTYIYDGSGSITFNDDGVYVVYSDSSFNTPLLRYTAPTVTLTLTDNAVNYVVFTRSTGVLSTSTDRSNIVLSDIIPVLTIVSINLDIHVIDWDEMSKGAVNKLIDKAVRTKRFEPEIGGVMLSAAGRVVNITSGVIWFGVNNQFVSESSSDVDIYDEWYHTDGVYGGHSESLCNNTYYDNGTNRVELTANRYAVNWIYRGVENQNHIFSIYGDDDYRLADALDSSCPAPSSLLSAAAIRVGRIIIQKGSSTPYLVESEWNNQFTSAGTLHWEAEDGTHIMPVNSNLVYISHIDITNAETITSISSSAFVPIYDTGSEGWKKVEWSNILSLMVTGPPSASDNNIVVFDGTTGTSITDSNRPLESVPYSGSAQDTIVDADTIPFWQMIGGLWKQTSFTNFFTSILAKLGVGSTSNQVLHGGVTPAFSSVVEADISLTNVTTNDVTTARHGFVPILPNNATVYLDGQGNYTTPSGVVNSYKAQTFTAQLSASVVHNFGNYPAVQVSLVDGYRMIPQDIKDDSLNQFTVYFAESTTGTILATIGSTQPQDVKLITTNYTVQLGDKILCCTNPVTITLLPVGTGTGLEYRIDNASTGDVMVYPSGSNTIEGESFQLVPVESAMNIYDNGNEYRFC